MAGLANALWIVLAQALGFGAATAKAGTPAAGAAANNLREAIRMLSFRLTGTARDRELLVPTRRWNVTNRPSSPGIPL